MKLLTTYNRVNFATTMLMMLITGIIYFQAITWVLTRQKDKDLKVEEKEVFDYVKLNNLLPQTFESNDQQITFYKTDNGLINRRFFDTAYFKKWDNESRKRHKHKGIGEYEAGRALITSVNADNQYYKVLIVESKVET